MRLDRPPDAKDTISAFTLPKIPRAGKKKIDEMVPDFLRAWLVEGDVVAAMGYVSERSYACLAQDAPDPSAFDRGLAPVQILVNLKAAHDALGRHDSLEGLTIGLPLPIPGLRAGPQPNQAQYVLYDVSDDLAARFDCASQLTPGAPTKRPHAYGEHFAATFRIAGAASDTSIALLWAKEDGYWKIVSWHVAPKPDATPVPVTPAEPAVVRIKADLVLVHAAKTFVDAWLVRKDYDAAFRVPLAEQLRLLRPRARSRRAGVAVRSTMPARRSARVSNGSANGLARRAVWSTILEAAEPLHPLIRVMDQPYSRIFSLTSFPTALADAVECEARRRGAVPPDPMPLEYGHAFGMTFRFRTQAGDAPVLRLLWRKEDSAWRVTSDQINCHSGSGGTSYFGVIFVILLPWIPRPAISPFWPKTNA